MQRINENVWIVENIPLKYVPIKNTRAFLISDITYCVISPQSVISGHNLFMYYSRASSKLNPFTAWSIRSCYQDRFYHNILGLSLLVKRGYGNMFQMYTIPTLSALFHLTLENEMMEFIYIYIYDFIKKQQTCFTHLKRYIFLMNVLCSASEMFMVSIYVRLCVCLSEPILAYSKMEKS